KETVGSKETIAASLDAQKKGLVMLKNADSLICERGDKPTVYIPMKYDAGKPATEANDSSPGTAAVPASANLPIDIRTLSKYVNIITDTVNTPYSGPADEDGNPTMIAADIIPPSDEELAKCDFALVFISAPSTGTGFDSATSTYIPKSLQYRPYTANGLYVRKNSIGGNIITVEVQDTYGAQSIKTVENRSYFGKTVTASNESDLDKVLNIAAKAEHTVVVVSASGPMIFSEFEDKVDAIIMNFGSISDEVILEIVAGKTEPSGLLPIQMPASMDTVEMQYEDVPRDMECHVDSEGNTYDFSFGLDWDGVIQDERVTKYHVDPIEG
ncbi:MAG TPA: glycoside hydrolase family 3 C-terminal domain-containing protein, partial [Clostridia bacterium]|nr:glycoside hydrolase family 3 C-terminal domain-containing protein [Clostridia bacterium]